MKMTLVNVSRKTIENFPFINTERDWLISIFSNGSTPACVSAGFQRIVFLQFDDEDSGPFAISSAQAKVIAKFVRDAEKNNVPRLWVNCDAGKCRSGAIVEAVSLLGHIPDDEISNHRIPNTTVFNEVRKALGFFHSWESMTQ